MTMTIKYLMAAALLLAMVDATTIRRGQGHMLKVADLDKMDKNALLRNAVKVDKRLHKRMLEDAGAEEGDAEQEAEGEEEAQNEEENANEDAQEGEEAQQEEGAADGEEEQAAEEEAVEEEEPLLQLDFYRCASFTAQPNNEEVTEYLAFQESIVFFLVGYGENDEERELFMTTLENWIAASTGYDNVCHQLDENDVDTIFSTISDQTFVDTYAQHAWYSGFNCLEDGSGFGTQLFLNEECTTYAPTMSNYYPFPEGTVFEAAEEEEGEEGEEGEEEAQQDQQANVDYSYRVSSDMTPYMLQNAEYFLQTTHYCEEREGEQEQGEEGENQQEAVAQDMEFCEKLFGVSVDVITCVAYGEEVDENQQQQEEEQQCECAEEEQAANGEAEGEEADAQDGEAEGEGEENADENANEGAEEGQNNEGERKKRRRNQECECAQQDSGYQIDYEEIGDVEASCSTVRNILQINPNTFTSADAEYVVSKWSNVKDGHQPSSQSSSNKKGWIIALVVLAVVAVIAMIAFASGRGKKKTESESTRSEPLVSSSNKPARKKKESIEIYFQGSKRQATTAEGSQC
jgi:hypothetical protein